MNEQKMKGTKVGAVIPVFNRSSDLKVLLESLEKQTFVKEGGTLDVLVVDNASTDNVADVVRQGVCNVELVTLTENRGACQGFNHGMRLLLGRESYDFLWLLDSDLWASESALERLIASMEEDAAIGLAGSLIVNSRDHTVAVEAGAMIDLQHGGVQPRMCNAPLSLISERIIQVDYVGSGVSLMRVEAARGAGCYDERYHFLWEDMDYGLMMQRLGWKVVAVTDSLVYHPPFTEKRSAQVDAYYGVRNPMITISKYAGNTDRIFILYNFLRRAFKGMFFRRVNGVKSLSSLTWSAISDFILGRLGQSTRTASIDEGHGASCEEVHVAQDNYIVLPSGTLTMISDIVHALKENGGKDVILVVQDYRKELFRTLPIDQFVIYNDKSPHLLFEHLRVFVKLMTIPGVVINPDFKRGSPFTYSHSKVATWDPEAKKLFASNENIISIWKLLAAVLCSEIAAVLLMLPVLLRSYTFRIEPFRSDRA